jgi:hypothetical protein
MEWSKEIMDITLIGMPFKNMTVTEMKILKP